MNEGTEHVWGRQRWSWSWGCMGRATIPALRGTRTLWAFFGEHLWANVLVTASESLSSCLLTLRNSSGLSRWIEAVVFQGLRDGNLKGLKKTGFGSVGFAAAWCLLSENMSCCGLHKCCLTPLLPVSKPISLHWHPKQHRNLSNVVAELTPETLTQVWWSWRTASGWYTPCCSRAHTLVLAGNNLVMRSLLGLFEARLQKKTSGYAIINRRIGSNYSSKLQVIKKNFQMLGPTLMRN